MKTIAKTIFFFSGLLLIGCGQEEPAEIFPEEDFSNFGQEELVVPESDKMIDALRDKDREAKWFENLDKASFWKIVEYTKSISGGEKERQYQVLVSVLAERPVDDILMFDYIWDWHANQAYTSDCWAIAYIANGGCSDDCFEYFRAWMISEGKDKYDLLTLPPEEVAEKAPEGYPVYNSAEQFMYAPVDAYQKKYGKSDGTLDEYYQKSTAYKPENAADFPPANLNWEFTWQEETISDDFPNFEKRFGWSLDTD